jgi:hypothetical protein
MTTANATDDRRAEGTVPALVRHPSGFASWQDLSGYLSDFGIASDDDHTCGLIEQAFNHWPNAEVSIER